MDGQTTGIRWDFTRLLEDIDYADDLLQLTSRVGYTQEKTVRLEENAGRVGLKLNPEVQEDESQQQEQRGTESERQRGGGSGQFHPPEAQVTRDGGVTLDIKKRTSLAYANFNRLNKIWSVRGISRKTKATLYQDASAFSASLRR